MALNTEIIIFVFNGMIKINDYNNNDVTVVLVHFSSTRRNSNIIINVYV